MVYAIIAALLALGGAILLLERRSDREALQRRIQRLRKLP